MTRKDREIIAKELVLVAKDLTADDSEKALRELSRLGKDFEKILRELQRNYVKHNELSNQYWNGDVMKLQQSLYKNFTGMRNDFRNLNIAIGNAVIDESEA